MRASSTEVLYWNDPSIRHEYAKVAPFDEAQLLPISRTLVFPAFVVSVDNLSGFGPGNFPTWESALLVIESSLVILNSLDGPVVLTTERCNWVLERSVTTPEPENLWYTSQSVHFQVSGRPDIGKIRVMPQARAVILG